MLIILKWWLFATLAQAAILEISIDGDTLVLEADAATDVDAKVASIADRLPQLEGSGCSANDGACVRSVVAAALRNAVAADPMPRPKPSLRAVADEWSTLPKAVGHDKTSSPAEPEAPQDLSLEFVSPAEHELVPCGWLYPRISFLMSNHRRATRAWQYCAAVADADGRRLTQRCAPFGTNSLHGHLIEEAGNYTLEAWIFHTELGGTNVSRRPFACAFVDRVEETPLPEVPPLDCDRMFSNETGLGHLRRAERDGGTLSFATSDGEPRPRDLVIGLRLAPRTRERAITKGIASSDEDFEPPAFHAVLALAAALSTLPERQQARTRVVLLPNGFANNGVKGMIAATAIESNAPRVRVDVVQNCPEGNAASFKRMSDALLELDVGDEAILVSLEDDIVMQPSALQELLELFAAYRPCLATLVDHPVLYAGDGHHLGVADPLRYGPTGIIAGRRRHWRTIPSTTTTFAATKSVYAPLWAADLLPDPAADFAKSSHLSRATSSVVAPLPGLSSPVERADRFTEQFLALYFDYLGYVRALQAVHDDRRRPS